MKILSITAQKPHSTGSGFYLTELVNNWDAFGHEQAVVAGIYKEDTMRFPEGVAVYPVFYLSDRDGGFKADIPYAVAGMSDEMPYESTRYQDMTEEMTGQYEKAFQKAVAEAVEALSPDVIVCHHLYLLTAFVRKWYPQKKVVGICHGSDLRQIRKNPRKREFIKTQIRKLDAVFALQKEQGMEIERIFSCEKERLHMAGAGYNADIFYKERCEKKTCHQIVFAGKVSEKKGVFSLLGALGHLSYPADSIVVKIAGGSGGANEYEAIRAKAEACKYRVDFTGALPQKELAALFRESDVFVLPSFFEGLALVTIEAMACGCKVVCSDIPGMKTWFDENIPGHRVEFVPLPKLNNTDEPVAEELPLFERRLSEAIQKKLSQTEEELPALEKISWKGISRRILEEAFL